jgi:hypothetical protein
MSNQNAPTRREWIVAQLHSLFDCNLSYGEVIDVLYNMYPNNELLVTSVLNREGEQIILQLFRRYPHLVNHPDWNVIY